jgi:hypothetical protein
MSDRPNDAKQDVLPAVPSRREILIAGAHFLTAPFV